MLNVIKKLLGGSKTKKVSAKIEVCEMSANHWWS